LSKQLTVSISERVHGPIAVDKDYAARIRETAILPTLQTGGTVVLDFSGITVATQSFVHAMISSVLRAEGKDVLRRIVFRNVDPSIRGTVQLVAGYSSVDYASKTPSRESVVQRIKQAEDAVFKLLPTWYPGAQVSKFPNASELVDALVISGDDVIAVQVKYVRGNVNAANLAQVIEHSGALFATIDQVDSLLVVLVSDALSEAATSRLLESAGTPSPETAANRPEGLGLCQHR
jgi:hypothetical protein